MPDRGYAIITGAYGAIGTAISEGMIRAGYKIILAGRDPHRLTETERKLQKITGSPYISCHALDLGIQSEVEQFASAFEHPLSVLINNAATAPKKRTMTADGIEMQFAINVLGYFWMMHYFRTHLQSSGNARIVNVASYWAGGLDFDDLEFALRNYDPDAAYRQSKQANRMLSAAFADVFSKDHITVNACHPGDVNSKLSNSLGFGGHETPAEGAVTPLWCATSPDVERTSGKYFENKKRTSCPFIRDTLGVERIYQVCCGYSGL